jgi:MFS transporter, DHA1 family, tetracycline resistance protein
LPTAPDHRSAAELNPRAFAFILFSAFLAVMGIGLIIPVIPFIVARYLVGDEQAIARWVGILLSTYAVCQFFASPVLGALSDRVGRRPVLLLCLLGSALGYVIFGIGGALWVLMLGRIIDGFTGGDIGTLFAYVGDITPPRERGQRYGMVGGVLGLGFIVGPSVGGLLARISLESPCYAAAAVTALNALFGYFVLPESLRPENRKSSFAVRDLNPFTQLSEVFAVAKQRSLFLVGFFYFLPFAQLIGIGGVFQKDVMRFTPTQVGYVFLLIGLVDVVMQGFVSGKLIPRIGERNMVLLGFYTVGVSYVALALVPQYTSVAFFMSGIVCYAVGSGFFEPAMNAMVSNSAGPESQGRIQGASQALQSISRIIGPLTASLLYGVGAGVPYLASAALTLAGIGLLFAFRASWTARETGSV